MSKCSLLSNQGRKYVTGTVETQITTHICANYKGPTNDRHITLIRKASAEKVRKTMLKKYKNF